MASVSPASTLAKDETALAQEVYNAWRRVYQSGHRDYVTRAALYERYYLGEQWDAADTAKLEAVGRPAMTLNLILPTVNAIYGEYANRRADFCTKPRRSGATEEVAGTLTKLLMQICDNNDYDEREGDMVMDGLIKERGYIDMRMDFDDNVNGEIRMRDLEPTEVGLDPTARSYDPATWNEVTVSRWWSPDEIEGTYGQNRRGEIEALANDFARSKSFDESFNWDRNTFGDHSQAISSGATDGVGSSRTLRSVRVIERQWFMLTKVREFVSLELGDTRPVPEGWDEEKVQAFRRQWGLQVRSRMTRKIRWRVIAGDIVLHDSWSPYRTFTVIPFFPYFRRGQPMGVVRNLIDPQKTVNKVTSQMLHVVNTTANSGWMVPTGTLTNMTAADLENKGAESGLVMEYNATLGAPEKIKPNQVPTGLDNVSTTAANSIREISGVNNAMLGLESAEVSGVALENKQLRGSLQLQIVLDNLKRTRKFVARKILELVQDFYTEERVVYITDRETSKQDALTINQQSPAGEIVNNLTLGEYDIVVASMPARDNFDESQFAQIIQLRETGVPIPGHWAIRYSSLMQKAELQEEVKQLEGIGVEPSPMEQRMAELQVMLLEGEVEELNAKVATLTTQAQLNTAKAVDLANDQPLQEKMLEAALATTQLEQATRLRVQRMKEISSHLKETIKAEAVRNQNPRPQTTART